MNEQNADNQTSNSVVTGTHTSEVRNISFLRRHIHLPGFMLNTISTCIQLNKNNYKGIQGRIHAGAWVPRPSPFETQKMIKSERFGVNFDLNFH